MYNYNRNRDYLGRPVGASATSLGISERWERMLCYSLGIFGLGWLSGLIMLVLERRNQNVQRHAKQAILIFGTISIIGLVVALLAGGLGWIPIVSILAHGVAAVIQFILTLVTFAFWVLLEVMAFLSPKTVFAGPRWDRFF